MHSKHDVEPNVDYNETLNAKENIQSIFENVAVGNMGEELCKKICKDGWSVWMRIRTDIIYEKEPKHNFDYYFEIK